MFGLLVAIVVLVFFVAGFVVGTLIVIAVRINLEDRARSPRGAWKVSILLHAEPQGSVARGVRRLLVGQRNGPRQLPSGERREDWQGASFTGGTEAAGGTDRRWRDSRRADGRSGRDRDLRPSLLRRRFHGRSPDRRDDRTLDERSAAPEAPTVAKTPTVTK